MLTCEERQAVAKTILDQLGPMFTMMTGARDFVALDSGLQFRIPYPKVNCVRITLTDEDLYTMEFNRIRGFKVTEVAKEEHVFASDLGKRFTEHTGLDTRM